MVGIRTRWDLRNHVWFWGIVILMLILNTPLFLFVRWPQGWTPAVAMLPVALVDCLIFLGIVQLVDKLTKGTDSA